mmetsp:Transcript_53182/g.78942  ORF Transcript_53182/g.78942 Transcript_53182/m.78942 type:complete len:190 (-) Transcript_53182:405-974(-)|eukprot:CAMPEP_0195517494 /NCGR_PEP_ID=MMETSP0794_2-20130614/10971_1 /TAXON_ID=515487 /ORGANISM="Stephanopyxis turris, Strain CCMP 815" /LENGTH=189 /DNA_ID=CAMNT_0040646309 /DNA_START=52 /DNA_END=621 /DNA_ORIENTATION=-
MSTSVLSPLAQPFFPPSGMATGHGLVSSDSCFAISYNGNPSCVCVDEAEVMRGITDEAIEECFPPTIEDIEELEETDFFVALMATLDMIEEKEEKSRGFSDVKKRWATRRKEGIPVGGRCRPPKEGDIVASTHRNLSFKMSDKIVPKGKVYHDGNRIKNWRVGHSMKHPVSKRNTGMHGHFRPIQQPRK